MHGYIRFFWRCSHKVQRTPLIRHFVPRPETSFSDYVVVRVTVIPLAPFDYPDWLETWSQGAKIFHLWIVVQHQSQHRKIKTGIKIKQNASVPCECSCLWDVALKFWLLTVDFLHAMRSNVYKLQFKADTHEGFCSRSMLQGHASGAKLLRVYQRFHGYTSSSGAQFPPRKMFHDI